jgi:transposase
MSKASETKKRRYSESFKEQIVSLVRSGRKPVELAKEFGCHATTIHYWLSSATSGQEKLSIDERQELLRLRKELRQVKEERDILAKATAWFAEKSQSV